MRTDIDGFERWCRPAELMPDFREMFFCCGAGVMFGESSNAYADYDIIKSDFI